MEISTPQKIKLLKLMELLRENSDEDHPLKTNMLCTMLKNAGISCDRRTLSRDIATLNECGYEIFSIMQGHDKAYYIVERSFSLPELKILIDAVQAASFITESKTENLIRRLRRWEMPTVRSYCRVGWFASIPGNTATSKSTTPWKLWRGHCVGTKRFLSAILIWMKSTRRYTVEKSNAISLTRWRWFITRIITT